MIDFETKRQKVLAYIKGLKTMPVVVTKGPAPEPVATIDGVKYYHKQEFNFEEMLNLMTPEQEGSHDFDLLTGERFKEGTHAFNSGYLNFTDEHPDAGFYLVLDSEWNAEREICYYDSTTTKIIISNFESQSFNVVDTDEEIQSIDDICLPTCSAYYGFLSEDGKTFTSYYNLKDDGAPTETIMVPVYDQNGVDPEKIEALKAVAAGGKVGEELLDELVDFIDNPPEPVIDDKIHALLTIPDDNLTATFYCGLLIEGTEAKVDWGDGTVEDLTAEMNMEHTYASAGDYEVKISGMATINGDEDEEESFFFIEHLRKIVLSNLMNSIENYAFSNCTNLTSITIPDSVTSIGDCAFNGCTNITSITIPDSVTSIGSAAFNCCTSLTSVIIPDSVTSISDSVFYYCTSLTSVIIGSGVVSIGEDAFGSCPSLMSITVNSDNKTYRSEGNCLIRISDNVLITGCKNSVIPDSVTSIGYRAFYNCTSLTSITIPDSVTSIENSAFNSCTSLTSVIIPDSVTSIGYHAFNSCTSLTSVIIGSGVVSIGASAFSRCNSIVSVTIGSSVTSIGQSAFNGCTSLTSITIPDSVTSIEDSAFNSCTNITSIIIPDSITRIKPYTFQHCGRLASVTIGSGVTNIDMYAFQYCGNLRSITIPNNVTSIAGYAFDSCFSMTSVTIGSSVNHIGQHAFSKCRFLAEVIFEDGRSVPVPVLEDANAFEELPSNYKIYVPRNLLSAWKSKNNWSSIADHIEEFPWGVQWIYGEFVTLSENIEVSFKPGALIENTEHKIDWGDGTVEDLIADTKITHIYATAGKHDFRVKGTSTIGDYAFINNTSLRSIDIPNTIISIGQGAFRGCSNLISIIIPDGVTKIDNQTFYECINLRSIDIPNSITGIGSYAFKSCRGLKSVIIPDGVTAIGECAFNGCTGLTSVTLGSHLDIIGQEAFDGCTSLTSVTIPDSVTLIRQEAFDSCTSLTSITIGSGVTSIGNYIFRNCTSLTSVIIPNGVTSIGISAFRNCNSLLGVTFEDGREAVPTLGDVDAFSNNASGRKFYVQSDLLDAWKAATNWASYAADIEALPAA